MKKPLDALRRHLDAWPEAYFAVPLTVGALTLSLRYYSWVTGRPVVEDLSAIPAALVTLVIIVLTGAVVGLLQKFLIGYLQEVMPSAPRGWLWCGNVVVFFALFWTALHYVLGGQ
jgi:tetrahydromethanopterin S-methyltransferase subunit C